MEGEAFEHALVEHLVALVHDLAGFRIGHR
jgi:hypothetical protein